MKKMNCWEQQKCGREPGGAKADEIGVCPAAVETRIHGMNSGNNGGRACWAVTGTFCGGAVQGTFAQKIFNCMECEFYKTVVAEEAAEFMPSKQIISILRNM
ncbi:MAG: hypothetical protein HPY53_07735 [Brevinematales bacterium]|nr:hypothetical protein [Brevinematales bacterium]